MAHCWKPRFSIKITNLSTCLSIPKMEQVVTTNDGSKYYIIEFDSGAFRKDSVKDVLRLLTEELKPRNGYTDVIIIAHGWREFRNPADGGTISLPNGLVPMMDKMKPDGVKPLYVAVSWPSLPSLKELPEQAYGELKRLLYDVSGKWRGGNINGAVAANVAGFSEPVKTPLEQAVEDTEHAIDSFLDAEEYDDEVAGNLWEKIACLSQEVAFDGTRTENHCLLDVDNVCETTSAKLVEKMYSEASGIIQNESENENENASRELETSARFFNWKDDKDKKKTKANKILQVLYTLVFGQFERRGSRIGSLGVHGVIAELMEVADKTVRFSAFGHSLGAHVVQGAAIGDGNAQFNRKMPTILMAQGACNRAGLEPGGAYRPLVSQLRPVAGPLLATRSKFDTALIGYKVAGVLGFGTGQPLGLSGFTEHESYEVRVKKIDTWFDWRKLQKGICFTLDGTWKKAISDHGDIDNEEVVDLFWRSATLELRDDDLKPTDLILLPSRYWSDYKVRTEMV